MRDLPRNLGIAASYFLLAYVTFNFLAAHGVFPAPLWPSASIALAAALMGGRRLWPGIYLGSFAANWLLFGASPGLAALISVSNVVGPAFGAALIRRTAKTTVPFFELPHVLWFVLFGALLHGLIAASGGVVLAVMSNTVAASEAVTHWFLWTLSDAGGTFLFAPALLLWWQDHKVSLTRAQWLENGAVVLVTLLLAAVMFFGIRDYFHPFSGLPYLLLVPLMWLTVRCSVRAGTGLLSLLALIAITGTIAEAGPFHLLGAERPLLGVGLMVVAMGVSTLAVGALVSERRAAEQRLRELNESLEQRIAERTAELHRRATQDGLTGLANRTHFFEVGEATLAAVRANGQSLSVLLIDMDRLKGINDSFGHSVGDDAIVTLALACRACVRKGDVLGRLGGDEFAILLPAQSATEAGFIAARIEAHLAQPSSDGLHITASIGSAELRPQDGSLDDVLARADAAMYERKRQRFGDHHARVVRFRTR